ncbi:alpha/beta fold hydrolase [Aurantimonas marianensis]|uniref:Alpha/beta hydrolase n=1 Tax=Aurantimonas marianensis TaxID=2920428 RepID=A0A9X2H575_9HYPH|nr:alpha/beta hydrolase [Aurantimonas marianensis]MCP3055537.1 alpha/beta hydrolase [Aurantimonas marianensis]
MNLTQIVMIPGLLCTDDLYRDQIASIPSDGVLVADTTSDPTITAMAERLVEVAPDRFFLCGLSMGGYVALEVLRIAPERVTALVLMATSAKADTAEQTAMRRRLVKLAHEKGIAAVAEILSDQLLGPSGRTDRRLRQRIAAMAEAIGADVFWRQQEAIIGRRDQTSLVPHIRVPTTLLAGTEDQIISPDRSREMAAVMPAGTLDLLDGVGHMVTMEAPDAASAVIRRHLQRDASVASDQLVAGPKL